MKDLWEIAVVAPLYDLLTYTADDALDLNVGNIVEVPLGKRVCMGVCISPTQRLKTEFEIKHVNRILYEGWKIPTDYLQWLIWVSEYYVYPLGLVLDLSFPPSLKTQSKPRKQASERSVPFAKVTLNSFQDDILKRILGHQNFGVHLLHGVTGSGKTEIYLELFNHFISQKGQGLFLLPEISLTPQMLNRFSARFPGQIAIIHSQLTPAQKNYEWNRIQDGAAKILIGARSALFCPVPDLSLIIIDEEHDSSFKQDSKLKYHAKSSATMLAKKKNIPIVLGSATPSLESWQHVVQKKYFYYSLSQRAKTEAPPTIELIDLKEKPKSSALPSWLSNSLYNEMLATLRRQEQVALFLNRRGTASIVFCDSCGFHFGCPNCDVALTLHNQGMLVCHYCEYQQSLKPKCPSCTEGLARPYGLGTEQLERDLKTLFPDARLARVDRDEVTHVSQLEEIIKLVENREVDILIGTQMIAKGLDFPSLKLVGFVLADIGLQMPDFRAEERACQLLFQMAGRSGRHATQADKAGKVLIQTFNPNHSIFLKVLSQDYISFLNEEFERRSELLYPPCGRMILFQVESKTLNLSESAALKLRDLALFASQAFRNELKLQILGPIPAPIPKIRNHFRYQLILKADLGIPLSKIGRWVLLEFNKLKLRVTIHVDIDPQHLL